MKRFLIVSAFLLTASTWTLAAAPPASEFDAMGPAMQVRHACVPSRCGCKGFRKTWCTRDCRRDRHCFCWKNRYVCRYFRR
ncbi:MAG: hypothetical protein ACREC6_14145 [Hyphomicrobiaceae bacterium]